MKQYLTTSKKQRLAPFILKRDGPNCFYCSSPFDGLSKELKRTYDHLDNNPFHNEPENLVLCHWKCNQLKKVYPEYKLMAESKIKENFDSLDVCVNPSPEPKETTKEIDINLATKRIVLEFLQDRLLTQGKPAIELSDTIHSISYLMYEKTNHGSSETVKRHIKDFCSSVAPFKIEEQNGEWVIIKRN
jgi:hypothetical protein